jgi:DNA polymerase-1
MKLMVLDGNSIFNRAFYGIRLLTTSDGLYTNAVYGFLAILRKLMTEDRPDGVCVAFDLPAPTFRHKMYDGYKATRKGMPNELASQLPWLKDMLKALNIPRYELEGYEADDLLGTISVKCAEKGWDCLIVTGDRDSLQLINSSTHVKLVSTKMGKTESTEYDAAVFIDKYGFEPVHMVDLKALMGDSSDCIPGVPGVGEKTAMELIQKYKSLNNVYGNLDSAEIKPSVKTKLETGRDKAYMSYALAEIERNAPLAFEPADNLVKKPDNDRLYELFTRLEFTKMIEAYGLTPPSAKPAALAEEKAETIWSEAGPETVIDACRASERVFFACDNSFGAFAVITAMGAYTLVKPEPDFLKQFFSESVKKAGHDVKSLMKHLLGLNLPCGGFVFDSSLAAYLLNPSENGYDLSRCIKRLFGRDIPGDEYNRESALGLLSLGSAIEALKTHAENIRAVYEHAQPLLKEQGMEELYNKIELPLCAVLAEMEHRGITVDRNALRMYGRSLGEGIDALTAEIYTLAGGEFNINSTKQLGELLFDKLRLPPYGKTKTGYSTNVEVLEKLLGKHPIIEKIMDYRKLTKLKSTYADGLMNVIAADGRIHTSFNMTATATGRLSSTEPNLQNIPVRTELGGELRRMFVAADGCVLIDADYSQIELRILAHLSNDEVMRRAFINGEDIHRVTASQVFNTPFENVTSLQRSRAKAVNFGIVYGISDFSLAEDIRVSRHEAKQYIDSYLEKYSGVRRYMSDVVAEAREKGYASTIFGRRRYLPEFESKNYNIRSFGERVALNMPVQGAAADIIKLAMVNVSARFKAEGMKAALLLQIHDELIAECPLEEAEKAKALLEEEMERVVSLSVPLVAEAHSGHSWYDAK